MRIDDRERYIKMLENAVIRAGNKILKEKCYGRFIKLRHKDIQILTDKYMHGAKIRQASFTREGFTAIEYEIIIAAKLALNQNHTFIFEKEIIDKIKKGDKTIIANFEGRRKKEIQNENAGI